MSFSPSISLNALFTALGNFIVIITGLDAAHVVRAQVNRVPMPLGAFAKMTQISVKRVTTNQDTWDPNDPAPTGVAYEAHFQVELQVDFYGPDSGDQAAVFCTLFRDNFGCLALAPNCQPLYCDDAMQTPLIDAEAQYEDRYTVRAQLQYDPVTTADQQFAAAVSVDLINVDVRYPAS